MNILVTGGAGFIGSQLVEGLLKAGHSVTVFDNLSSGRKDHIPAEAAFYQGDLQDLAAVENVFTQKHFDIVFHEATETAWPASQQTDAEGNVNGFLHVLQQCRKQGVQKLIFASSASVYGNQDTGSADEETQVRPKTLESLIKVSAEAHLIQEHQQSGLPYAILRYANVYGERQASSREEGVIGQFARALIGGEPLTIYGDGNQSRDFIYVKDVVAATLAAMDTDVPSGIYNVSTNIETTINALKEILMYFAQLRPETVYEEARREDVYRSVLNNEKAIEALHWRPKTKLLPGLMAAFSYYLGSDEL